MDEFVLFKMVEFEIILWDSTVFPKNVEIIKKISKDLVGVFKDIFRSKI
jgi:hypothetical protein